MYKSLEELEGFVLEHIKSNQLNEALENIKDFVEAVCNFNDATGVVFSSSLLDELCQQIGAQCAHNHDINSVDIPCQPNQNIITYIATELYLEGGHTAVVEDLIRSQPTLQHVIMLTNIVNQTDRDDIIARFSNLPVILLCSPSGKLIDKLIWLQLQLKKHNPGKTFLFNHNQDCVAIAAVQPGTVSELFFYHHGDHHLCLGVHLDHALHIDPHPVGFHNCRQNLGIKNNIYWPLTVTDQNPRPKNKPFFQNGVIKTCSSGRSIKFTSSYIYSYVQLVPKILEITGGQHIHIGLLPQHYLDEIYQRIEAIGISKSNFIYIPWTRSVWKTLIEQDVDLYITSFPVGGGKTSIEVMGAGIPIIIHSNYRSQLLGSEWLGYPGAFCWKKPDELMDFLKGLNSDFLANQSELARRHYERFHRPEIIMEELNRDISSMGAITSPSLPAFRPDVLQIALDQLNAKHAKNQELDKLQYQLTTIYRELELIYASHSWRITKPLRQIKPLINRIKENYKKWTKKSL